MLQDCEDFIKYDEGEEFSCLHECAEVGNIEIFDLLISKGSLFKKFLGENGSENDSRKFRLEISFPVGRTEFEKVVEILYCCSRLHV